MGAPQPTGRLLDLPETLEVGTVERDTRVVDDGIIISAGIASGIDRAFYVVERRFGREGGGEKRVTSSGGGRPHGTMTRRFTLLQTRSESRVEKISVDFTKGKNSPRAWGALGSYLQKKEGGR